MSESKFEEIKGQPEASKPSVTQAFDKENQTVVLTGPFPEVGARLDLPKSFWQPQTKEEYEQAINKELLTHLVPEGVLRCRRFQEGRLIINKLKNAAENPNPSYTQGLPTAEILTEWPFAYSQIKINNPVYNNPREGKTKSCQLSIAYLNSNNELSGFSIHMIEYGGRYLSNIAVLSRNEETPTAREMFFASSLEMLPEDKPKLNLEIEQSTSKKEITASLKAAINSKELEQYINIDRLREGTKDSFMYLQEVIKCFPEQKAEKPERLADLEKLKKIYTIDSKYFVQSGTSTQTILEELLSSSPDDKTVNFLLDNHKKTKKDPVSSTPVMGTPFLGDGVLAFEEEDEENKVEEKRKRPVNRIKKDPKTPLPKTTNPVPKVLAPHPVLEEDQKTICDRFLMTFLPCLGIAILAALAILILVFSGAAGIIGAGLTAGALAAASTEAAVVGTSAVVAGSGVSALGIYGLSKLCKNSNSEKIEPSGPENPNLNGPSRR